MSEQQPPDEPVAAVADAGPAPAGRRARVLLLVAAALALAGGMAAIVDEAQPVLATSDLVALACWAAAGVLACVALATIATGSARRDRRVRGPLLVLAATAVGGLVALVLTWTDLRAVVGRVAGWPGPFSGGWTAYAPLAGEQEEIGLVGSSAGGYWHYFSGDGPGDTFASARVASDVGTTTVASGALAVLAAAVLVAASAGVLAVLLQHLLRRTSSGASGTWSRTTTALALTAAVAFGAALAATLLGLASGGSSPVTTVLALLGGAVLLVVLVVLLALTDRRLVVRAGTPGAAA